MKKFLLTIFSLLLVVGAYAQMGGMKGVVVSRDGREPIGGVVIFIDDEDMQTTTNQDGEFYIEGLAPGQYLMRFEAIDFEDLEVMVRVKELVHDMQNVVMVPSTMMTIDDSAFAELDTDVESAGDSQALPTSLSASKDIFNNIKTGVYNSKPDVEKQMWIKTLTLYPYDTEYFIHLLNTHDEAFDEIKELISWYNLPMDDIADTLLAGKYDFSNITELEEARRQKELLIADLSKFGIKESRLTDDADAKIEEILVQRRTYEDITYDTEEDCGYARELDGRLGAEVEAAAGKSLPELVELYTGMTDCEDAEKYAVICTKNALLLHTLLINAVKDCASAEELTSYKERIEGSKAKEISTPVIKQIDSKIKSINLSGNLNDAKEKLVGSAKDIFGKAKGLFKK